jgi:hypothetical protein
MAVYSTTVPSPAAPEVVFGYLADFRSCADWDPSVRAARLLTEGEPVRLGARFAVNAGGIPLVYETVELDAPRTVVLRGTHFSMVSLDRITFAAREDGGTDVTYRAQVDLRGPFRLLGPLLTRSFPKVGDRARAGLVKALAAL